MIARPLPPEPPIDALSMVLFRLGERCNHACPMCTNSGRPELDQLERDELLARLDHVHALGFRRLVLTGGEPTIHPSFFALAEAIRARGMAWDLNTHGRSFHRADFARRARATGLERAIVSLHGHDAEVSGWMSGAPRVAFDQTLAGLANLVAEDVEVMVNLVLSKKNLGHLDAWLELLARELGTMVSAKICFPSLDSKGRDWDDVQLAVEDVRLPLARARATASRLGLALVWESVPNCITGDPSHGNLGRLGFGETHYLDDSDGRTIVSIARIEAATARFHPDCLRCAASDRCSGVSATYAARFGTNALVPFPRRDRPWWLG